MEQAKLPESLQPTDMPTEADAPLEEAIKDVEPKLHGDKILQEPPIQKIKGGRLKRRYAQRVMTDIAKAVTRYINMYFKFYGANKKDVEGQAKQLTRLNGLWKAWLKEHADVYKYDECKDFFLTRINYLFVLNTTMSEEQIKEIETAGEVSAIGIPDRITAFLRTLESDPQLSLTQYGEDIFYTDKNVTKHTDNTEDGKNTLVIVLVNDGDYKFCQDDKQVDMPVGKLLRFDARIEHYIIANELDKRFAAMIWDVPAETSTQHYLYDISLRLDEIGKGE